MTIQLSRLITSAEIDATKYKAGAEQKVAADRAMVASAQAVGQSVAANDTKISQAGDAVARLSRQYVEGFSAQQRFEGGLTSLGRGLDSGKIRIEQAQSILVGMNQKLGLSANASELAAKGQTQLAAAVRAANAQIAGQVVEAERARAAATRLQAANANMSGRGAVSFAAPGQFNTANIAAQFQDIAVTSAMGMSPLQIALQQGTQLSAVLGPLGAAGSAKALGSALLSVVSPASLVTLALVGGTAAAIQYFAKGRDGTKALDTALKAHEAQLKLIEEGWGKAAVAEQKYGKQSASAATFGFEMSTTELRAQLRKRVPDVLSSISSATDDNIGDIGGARAFRGTALFKLLSAEVGDLVEKAKNGQPDIVGLTQRIEELGDASGNKGIRNLADDIANAVRPIEELARKVLEANKQLEELRRNFGPGGIPLRRGAFSTENMGSLDQFNAAERVAANRRQQANEAQLQGIIARSPAERAAAARSAAGAQYNDDESVSVRRDRIETAGKMALAEANHTLAEAQKDRARSLDQTLSSQQLDLDLIGKTAGETARLRMEFEQIAAVRAEAARDGIAADEAEIAGIKEKAAQYGKFADEIARANLVRDLGFERDQMFRSSQDQQIASRQQGAGLAVDLNSPEAQQMRAITRFGDAKGLASGFLSDFKSELLSSGGDIGKSLGTSILNALTNSMDKAWSSIFDRLATAFASALTGQTPGGGAIASAGTSIVGSILGGANDNYSKGAVSRSPLGAVGAGAYGSDLASNIRALAGNIGANPRDIAAAMSFESGFKPNVWGGAGGKYFGLIQAGASERKQYGISPSGSLADQFGGIENFFKGRGFKPGMSGLDLYSTINAGSPGRYNASDAANGGTWGTVGDKWNSQMGPHFAAADALLGPTNKAAQALDTMSGSALDAGKSLTSTIGDLGKSLVGGIGGKGGLASILDGLKPSNFQANTSLSDILGYGGGAAAPSGGGGGGIFGALLGFLPKLFGFADGTESAPDGWAWVGERGPELRKLRAGDTIRNNARSMQMAANDSRSSPAKIELHTHVNGGSGDDHIRMLSKQGANEAIAQYQQGQERGGISETQRRYASQKG